MKGKENRGRLIRIRRLATRKRRKVRRGRSSRRRNCSKKIRKNNVIS